MVHAILLGVLLLVLVLIVGSILILGTLHLTTATTKVEEAEVLELVAHANHPVFRQSLVQLYAGHREVEHTGGLVFHLHRHVVEEGNIYTQQR